MIKKTILDGQMKLESEASNQINQNLIPAEEPQKPNSKKKEKEKKEKSQKDTNRDQTYQI